MRPKTTRHARDDAVAHLKFVDGRPDRSDQTRALVTQRQLFRTIGRIRAKALQHITEIDGRVLHLNLDLTRARRRPFSGNPFQGVDRTTRSPMELKSAGF